MKIIMLPVFLILEFKDIPQGVEVHHIIRAGLEGFGHLLDPFFHFAMPRTFEKAMDEHCHHEFKQLEKIL